MMGGEAKLGSEPRWELELRRIYRVPLKLETTPIPSSRTAALGLAVGESERASHHRVEKSLSSDSARPKKPVREISSVRISF